MQKINGIGGVFIVAQNPEMLGKWYQKYLGVPLPPASYEEPKWMPKQEPTVFASLVDSKGNLVQLWQPKISPVQDN